MHVTQKNGKSEIKTGEKLVEEKGYRKRTGRRWKEIEKKRGKGQRATYTHGTEKRQVEVDENDGDGNDYRKQQEVKVTIKMRMEDEMKQRWDR